MSRSYCYVLYTGPVRVPHLDRPGWLGVQTAPGSSRCSQAAAAMLIGEHDFSAFRSVECQAKSPVKTLHQASTSCKRGEMLVFQLRANAFLHHMVRNLIGSLIVCRAQQAASPDYLARAA